MINQLVNNIKKLDAPIVVGLDPMLDYVPEYIKKAAFAEYGETLEGAAEAIWQYNKGIIDATYDLIPAVKPQIAMYEQFGVPGLVAFNKTCEYAKSKGLVIIGDIKRGDIGSTSKAYAIGHVGKVAVGSKTYSGFCEDFVTVNPYLGSDGIRPFMEVCKEEKEKLEKYLQVAEKLYTTAIKDGWDADGAPGIVYTTDWQGKPVVHDRMHWTLAEAINTSAVLYHVTGREKYAKDYAEFMKYLVKWSWITRMAPGSISWTSIII